MSHVTITCQCGRTADCRAFMEYRGRRLVANQWHCTECGVLWELQPKKIVIIHPPRRQPPVLKSPTEAASAENASVDPQMSHCKR